MKLKIFISVFLIFLITTQGFSQEKSKGQLKKEQKEKVKLEKEKKTEALIESKTFVFIAETALPMGTRSINLRNDNYSVIFQPDMIESFIPFFGRAYSGAGFGNDNGLMFKEKPKSFDVKKTNKNYQIDVVVNKNNNNYQMSLTVSFEGGATLSVTSSNRSTITYQGYLEPIKQKPVDKQ